MGDIISSIISTIIFFIIIPFCIYRWWNNPKNKAKREAEKEQKQSAVIQTKADAEKYGRKCINCKKKVKGRKKCSNTNPEQNYSAVYKWVNNYNNENDCRDWEYKVPNIPALTDGPGSFSDTTIPNDCKICYLCKYWNYGQKEEEEDIFAGIKRSGMFCQLDADNLLEKSSTDTCNHWFLDTKRALCKNCRYLDANEHCWIKKMDVDPDKDYCSELDWQNKERKCIKCKYYEERHCNYKQVDMPASASCRHWEKVDEEMEIQKRALKLAEEEAQRKRDREDRLSGR